MSAVLPFCTDESKRQVTSVSVVESINRRDLQALAAALRAGADPDRKDETGNPPLLLAAATAQFRAANLLLDAGADIWATDDFGLSPGAVAHTSRVLDESVEGEARKVFVDRLRHASFPWPPPNPVEAMKLIKDGKWPPVRAGTHR